MDLKIKGKRALVQGSSAGLGRAIAEALIAEGVQVAICARNQAKLEQVARDIGAAAGIVCDLSKAGASAELMREAQARLGGVDILVTNTGGPKPSSFEGTSPEQWQSGFQSLWLSAVESIQLALPGMKERKWGRILLVTSAAAREPRPDLTVSNGLRAGLLGLAKTVSNEVAQHGITVNTLLPSFTDTERLRELGLQAEKVLPQIPARRLGRPVEFAALAAFLASEHAGYVTGQAIAVDGGALRGA